MVALVACGGSTSESGATAPPASPALSTPSTGSSYLPSPEPELTVPATRLGRLERLSGVVGRGVEHGCLLLSPRGGGRALQLLVEDPRVVEGADVTVEGYRTQGAQASTCQEGVPFTVTKVVDIGPAGS